MYTNLLTQIKNAQAVKKEKIKLPYSEMDMLIAELLAKHKYVEAASKKGRMPKRILEVSLRYVDEKGALSDFKILSKPSRRLYSGYKDLRPVRQNFGLGIVSTSKGIMTSRDARKAKVGGQLLFEVW